MKSYKTVDEYILNAPCGKEILIVLHEIIRSTELKESIKWGGPVYTLDDKNVVGIGSFKSYTGLWFYQGAFLKDEAGILINASEGITKALRQWRFTSVDEIDDQLILKYVNEAIQNQKEGKEWIGSAKLAETRTARVQKVIPLILENIGLNDKYPK